MNIPEIPANLTADPVVAMQLQLTRVALLQAEEARKLAIQHEANAAARHAALLAQHKANNGELEFAEFAAATLCRAPWGPSKNTLKAEVTERWALAQEMAGAAPAPAPAVSELDPEFYLAELGDEFDRYGWPRTLQGAIDHWNLYGKTQGRRGRAGGPGWGPKAEDAPPGTQL